jgi:hypothetical protein
MKKILTAVLFAGVLLSASFAGAQENAAATPPSAAAPLPAAATAPPSAAAPVSPAQQAPASTELPAWLQYKPTYTGEENDIANPHRTSDEMTTWAQQAAADVLTFDKANYSDRMSGFKKYFVLQGWQLYAGYLRDSKILSMVHDGGYAVGAIVDEVPEVVHSGATNGAYHWIMRMPITVSFFKKDPATGDMKTGPSGKFYLFLDILRVPQGGGDDGIAIINWRIMDVPKN